MGIFKRRHRLRSSVQMVVFLVLYEVIVCSNFGMPANRAGWLALIKNLSMIDPSAEFRDHEEGIFKTGLR